MNGDIASRDLEAEVTVVHEQGDVEYRGLLLVLALVEVREIQPIRPTQSPCSRGLAHTL